MNMRPLLASTFLVLLSACSAECSCNANGNDDGEGGGGGDTPTTTTGSPTGTGGGDAGGSPTGTGGQGGGTGGAGQGGGGTGGDGTGGGAGGGGDVAGYCALGCEVPADCCGGAPDCPSDVYPYNWQCNEGVCESGGCSSNDECTFGGALPEYGCFDIGGVGACFEACDVDEDCSTAGFTCTGESDDGTYCLPPPFNCNDSEDGCFGNGTCQEDGSCTCAGNEECTTEGTVCVE